MSVAAAVLSAVSKLAIAMSNSWALETTCVCGFSVVDVSVDRNAVAVRFARENVREALQHVELARSATTLAGLSGVYCETDLMAGMICVFAWPNMPHTGAGNTASFTARLSICSVPPRALSISSPRRPLAMFMPMPFPALSPAN